MERKIPIEKVNSEISKKIGEGEIEHGEDVSFLEEIDTSPCEEFFGTRCFGEVHVTGKRTAHRDRYDPRTHWKEHLDEDVGVPHEVVTVGAPTALAACAGAATDTKKRERGALVGGLVALGFSGLVEALT